MFCSYQRLTYDSNTVIIQVCVAGMPSDIQAGFQSSVAKRLATLLASTDVTLTSVFTDTHNNLCMYYAYQAHDAPSAQRAFLLLGPRGIGVDSHSAALPIEFVDIIWQTVVTLSPWQAEVRSAYRIQPINFCYSENFCILRNTMSIQQSQYRGVQNLHAHRPISVQKLVGNIG